VELGEIEVVLGLTEAVGTVGLTGLGTFVGQM
jgi:hypothetical protein